MPKKQNVLSNRLQVLLIILAVLATIGFVSTQTGEKIKIKEDLVIYFPPGNDFPDPRQGRMTLEFRFPDNVFKVGNEIADVILFLESQTVPGLKLSYNQKEKKIYGGLPLLVSKEVELMDGNSHKLVYAFNREQKKQTIVLDGTLLASGRFYRTNPISGLVVYEGTGYTEMIFPIQVGFE